MTFPISSPRGNLLRSLLLGLAIGFMQPALAEDNLPEVQRLMKQAQYPQALEKVDAYLSSRPKDAQGRFLKGLILSELNRANDAINVFTKLTEDYPELPEPYNNLAVLYAQQKQYEKAKAALEMAIRAHPTYAMAYENLGDIQAKLASQSYEKAIQLDSGNGSAQNKLVALRDAINGKPSVAKAAAPVADPAPVAKPEPVAAKPVAKPKAEAPVAPKAAETADEAPVAAPAKPVAVALAPKAEKPAADKADQAGKLDQAKADKAAKLEQLKAEKAAKAEQLKAEKAEKEAKAAQARQEKQEKEKAEQAAKAEKAKAEREAKAEKEKAEKEAKAEKERIAKAERDAKAEKEKAEKEAKAAASAAVAEEVNRAITAWAEAWSRKDVRAYLGSYAGSFVLPEGFANRQEWEILREGRIAGRVSVQVTVDTPKIKVDGDKATAKFRQRYRSTTFNGTPINEVSDKTLIFIKENGKWMIQQELAGV